MEEEEEGRRKREGGGGGKEEEEEEEEEGRREGEGGGGGGTIAARTTLLGRVAHLLNVVLIHPHKGLLCGEALPVSIERTRNLDVKQVTQQHIQQ